MVSVNSFVMKLIPLLLVFFSMAGTLGSEVSKSPFAIAVVPSQNRPDGGIIEMAQKAPDEFYVVLTNLSTEPQNVWETWNSWGYQAISFELTTANGRKTVLSMRRQDFTVNFPSTFLIQPGEHQVFPIRLGKEWEAHPAVPKADEMPITLKAVYEATSTPEAPQYKVWIGRVESRSYSLTLRQ